jgi:hypothetical protein
METQRHIFPDSPLSQSMKAPEPPPMPEPPPEPPMPEPPPKPQMPEAPPKP